MNRPALKTEIALRVRARRMRADITQAELAAMAGVHVRTLQHVESGRALPDLDTTRRLAEALGVPLDVLVPGVNSDPTEI